METMENHGMDAEFNFESALEDYLSTDFGDLEEGTIVKGEIVRVDDDNVLVDVNFKSEGQIPTAEFRDAEGNLVTLWIWAAWKRSSPVPMWICAPCRTWTLW